MTMCCTSACWLQFTRRTYTTDVRRYDIYRFVHIVARCKCSILCVAQASVDMRVFCSTMSTSKRLSKPVFMLALYDGVVYYCMLHRCSLQALQMSSVMTATITHKTVIAALTLTVVINTVTLAAATVVAVVAAAAARRVAV
jgi:hypothetical protein